MTRRPSPHLTLCLACLDDRTINCPRDADALCLICQKAYCGAHIAEHLASNHCVEVKRAPPTRA